MRSWSVRGRHDRSVAALSFADDERLSMVDGITEVDIAIELADAIRIPAVPDRRPALRSEAPFGATRANLPHGCLCYHDPSFADVAQLVERNLAKVEVAGSNPVVRSSPTAPPRSGLSSFSAARAPVGAPDR